MGSGCMTVVRGMIAVTGPSFDFDLRPVHLLRGLGVNLNKTFFFVADQQFTKALPAGALLARRGWLLRRLAAAILIDIIGPPHHRKNRNLVVFRRR